MAYRFKLPQTPAWHRKHDVFNDKLLKPFIKPSFDIQPNDPPAPADLVEEEEEYKVEAILDSCKKGRHIEYLVKWKGYSDAENSWEPCDMLKKKWKTSTNNTQPNRNPLLQIEESLSLQIAQSSTPLNRCLNSQHHHGDHDLKGGNVTILTL